MDVASFADSAPLGRIARAINDHDLDGLTDAFSQDVDSRQPVHPHRDFQGRRSDPHELDGDLRGHTRHLRALDSLGDQRRHRVGRVGVAGDSS